MDVGSKPHSRPDLGRRVDDARTSPRFVRMIALALGLVLLALLVALTDLLLQAQASEPVLSAPFRWHV
jgi:hypothetical protein